MKKIDHYIRYTTEAALDYATKKLQLISFVDPKNPLLKQMKSKKIKIIIKVYEVE